MDHPEANIVLIGMPGCGKSSIGQLLAQQMKREFLDTDQLIEQKTHLPVTEIFARHGEAFFRAQEAEIAEMCSHLTGKVIATGGGMVLNPENIRKLKQTGRVYYLRRDLCMLARKGRPLSCSMEAIEKLFEQRTPLYLEAADCVVDNQGAVQQAVQAILEDFNENSGH
ncbi:MAG: shikimate kinase [Lentisphaerae bacterium]|jgi:shikimate dehydrogenase|nr:shikimate kinase [Lentisphaerota bacterium]